MFVFCVCKIILHLANLTDRRYDFGGSVDYTGVLVAVGTDGHNTGDKSAVRHFDFVPRKLILITVKENKTAAYTRCLFHQGNNFRRRNLIAAAILESEFAGDRRQDDPRRIYISCAFREFALNNVGNGLPVRRV